MDYTQEVCDFAFASFIETCYKSQKLARNDFEYSDKMQLFTIF